MTYRDAIRAGSVGDFAPAIAILNGHLAYTPEDDEAWMYLGIAYTETGHLQSALKALRKAEGLGGANARLYEALGCTYLRLDNPVVGELYLSTAKEFPDTTPSVDRNLGVAYLKSGDPDRAIRALQTARKGDPDDILTLYALSLALCERAGTGTGAVQITEILNDILRRPTAPEHILRETAIRLAFLSAGWEI